ncbi:CHAP domain-containing protein [Clostridium sp. SHJSY1]|uniref:CHAP domain-containing protein n=1 Tax=Clostridium sp. SHJSY1 TaxID=2942483 RepID=UPI002874A7C8|nr:CHAP domain-containing protein [Clostridium sp. SHJSY1]MDS0525695.1 CHAP domain-containing protein [Clostridium sp. SHJSY1]
MKKIYKVIVFLLVATIAIGGGIYGYKKISQHIEDKKRGIGEVLDSYKGVDVYYNGEDYTENHGKSYSKDGYYYGYKWQCVEYIKRFFYDAKGHKMSDGFGNAKDFFDVNVGHGKLNEKRGLIQYKNGEDEKPKADDLLVFTDTTYGHVVIISEVGENYIEVVQQNMGNSSRDKFKLEYKDGKYFVGGKRVPAGWLRKSE